MAVMEAVDLKALAREVQELRKMRDELNYLKDRQAILDTLNRYTHAVDRHDWELLQNEVYHPDGIADHGGMVGSAKAISEWLNGRYHELFLAHFHVIANHLCEIDGNTAHTETYVVTYALMKDGKSLQCSHARYVDRLEKRPEGSGGKWKIALRRIVTDARSEITTMGPPNPAGKWDKTDPSYQRPLTLPPERAAQIKK